MIKTKEHNWWILIENKVLFWAEEIDKKYINLLKEEWEDMIYDNLDYYQIEFPWEYNIEDIDIKCFSSKKWLLDFVLNIKWKKIAILQTKSLLKNSEIWKIEYRLYTDPKLEQKIEQIELEWEKIFLWTN